MVQETTSDTASASSAPLIGRDMGQFTSLAFSSPIEIYYINSFTHYASPRRPALRKIAKTSYRTASACTHIYRTNHKIDTSLVAIHTAGEPPAINCTAKITSYAISGAHKSRQKKLQISTVFFRLLLWAPDNMQYIESYPVSIR